MCGRVVQASGPDLLGLRIVNSFEGRDRRGGNLPPRYNAAQARSCGPSGSTLTQASARSTS
jgi:hypothetical protein